MARIRSSKLETPTARLRLPMRRKPYKIRIARGVTLGYRRNKRAGSWSVEVRPAHGDAWLKRFADADDHDRADGESILNFWQAQDKGKALATGKSTEGEGAPVTVAQAIDAYEKELEASGGDPKNARRIRRHLSSALGSKCVALLSTRDLQGFRDGLTGLEPSGRNRVMKCLKAALNAAAVTDSTRITNNAAWKIGLKLLPEGDRARRLVLADRNVTAIVTAAYAIDCAFGVFTEVEAVSGGRSSQIERLVVDDLQADRSHPRLLMPPSRKGRKGTQKSKVPVPITVSLAALLRDMAKGRPADAPLLVTGDGTPWDASNAETRRLWFAEAVRRCGLDPGLTPYCLRHSSIARQLLKGVPVAIVAATHDTSIQQITRHYGRYITDHSDALTRGALLDFAPSTGDNVVSLGSR